MATIYWTGAAVPVAETQTVTLSLTWATNDTLALTLNGKTLTLTVGSTATVTAIALAAVAMVNGDALVDDESRTGVGTDIGEWALVTASSSAGVITFTGQPDGRPIGTITATPTTAGDGTALQAAAISASGPSSGGVATNWSSGTVPGTDDTVIFDERAAAGLKYGLDCFDGDSTVSIRVEPGFKYQIGLPEVNTLNPTLPFDEPNLTHLTTDGVDNEVMIDAKNAQMIKIDMGSAAAKVVVSSSGSTTEPNAPPVQIKANHSGSYLTVRGGSVGLNWGHTIAGEVAAVYVNGGTLYIGDATTIAALTQTDGSTICYSSITTATINAGTFEHRDGAITTLNMNGGVLYDMTDGTYGTVYHVAGTIDCSRDGRARTYSVYHIYTGAQLKDPVGTVTFTADIDVHCKISEVKLDLPPRRTFAVSAFS